jgi:hypothetical protein
VYQLGREVELSLSCWLWPGVVPDVRKPRAPPPVLLI